MQFSGDESLSKNNFESDLASFVFFCFAAISRQQVDETDITMKKNRTHCEKKSPFDRCRLN